MWRLCRSLSEVRTSFSRGSLSPTDLLESCLRAGESVAALNAFTWMDSRERLGRKAEEAAKRWREGRPLGPMDGVPVSIKDVYSTSSGRPTTCGSEMLLDYRPPYSAAVVDRLERAGAIVVGKTNLDEFAMGSGGIDSVFGPSKSVWRSGIEYELADEEDRPVEGARTGPIRPPQNAGGEGGNEDVDWVIAGGSSGGSAVSVSCGVVAVSVGSDTGGSARIPGAWNGLFALKPTYGAVSRRGLIPLVNSLDCPSFMAGGVDDLAEVFNVVKGVDPGDSTTYDEGRGVDDVRLPDDPDVSSMTVGIPVEYRCDGMSEEVLQAWSDVADLMENNGVRVQQVSLPHTRYSITCYSVLNPCEVASNMARYDGLRYGLRGGNEESTEAMYAEARKKGFNDVVRSRILTGNFFLLKKNYDEFFLKALKVRRLVKDDFDRVWRAGVDLLLTPATLCTAPTFREFSKLDNRTQCTMQDYCTQPANLAGLPAATVPVRLSQDTSLPIGLQIVGRSHRDQDCLSLAKWLQNRVRFPLLRLKSS